MPDPTAVATSGPSRNLTLQKDKPIILKTKEFLSRCNEDKHSEDMQEASENAK
jgi:hypothetical protein